MDLKGFQKQYLKQLAHDMKPVIFIGRNGITDNLLKSLNDAFNSHELVKVKFNDFKEKESKHEISDIIVEKTGSSIVGMVGHTLTLYRMQEDPEKRKIIIPER